MIRIFLLLVVFVALIAAVLHISAGWAWIIALAVIAGFFIVRARSGRTSRYVKTSAAWKCPYCLKRVKLGATACHHCGRSLLRNEVGT